MEVTGQLLVPDPDRPFGAPVVESVLPGTKGVLALTREQFFDVRADILIRIESGTARRRINVPPRMCVRTLKLQASGAFLDGEELPVVKESGDSGAAIPPVQVPAPLPLTATQLLSPSLVMSREWTDLVALARSSKETPPSALILRNKWNGLMRQAGITEEDIRDDETRAFIMTFVHEHGGLGVPPASDN